VKDNQPKLRAQLAALPWRDVPATADTRERGHGRHERRTPQVTAVAAGLRFPHAAQAIQIVRRRKPRQQEMVNRDGLCRHLADRRAGPARSAGRRATRPPGNRGSSALGSRPHLRRRPSQVRIGSGPRVMATLRNLALAILRLAGATSIAAALRRHSRPPDRPFRPSYPPDR
jgi:hypothetical protein